MIGSALPFALLLHATAPVLATVPATEEAESPALDPRVYIGGGVAAAVVSSVAFAVGFEAERQLREAPRPREEQGELLFRRAVAAWVAWPLAVGALGAIATGSTLVVLDELEGDAVAPGAAP